MIWNEPPFFFVLSLSRIGPLSFLTAWKQFTAGGLIELTFTVCWKTQQFIREDATLPMVHPRSLLLY